MAELEQFLEGKIKLRSDFFEKHLEPYEQEFNTFIKDFEAYSKALIRAKKTGNYKPVSSKKVKVRESFKENNCPNTEIAKNKISNKNVIKVKTEKLSIVAPSVKNVDSEEMPAPKMLPPKRKVKKEKVSINVKAVRGRDNSEYKRSTRSCTTSSDRNSDVVIQSTPVPIVNLSDSEEEKIEPLVRSTRTRTIKNSVSKDSTSTTVRSTRTRTKNIQLQNETESILANGNNETSNVLESQDEEGVSSTLKSVNKKTKEVNNEIESPEQVQRMTRTKTKAKPKRERSHSEVDASLTKPKRSKSDSKSDEEEKEEKNNTTANTEYEDAVSETEVSKNSTFILPMKPTDATQSQSEESHRQIANQTVVLDNPNSVQPHSVNHADDLLTDDDSVDEQRAMHTQKSKMEVFSPYVRSPVKKKVEAFEKYQRHDAQGSSTKANTSKVLREIEENKGNVKEKAKGFTPISTRTMYKNGPPSNSKIGKYVGYKSTLNDSLSSKYTPAKLMKMGSIDHREKELKRQERELKKQEVELKKQEMMNSAGSLDRKKKYEEKLLKVQQQQKEAIEREKQKAMELQRSKEERHKLLLQQKEEKQRQLKEENEKKRLLAKQRAEEKRKEEESQRILAHQEKLKNDLLRRKAEAEDLRKKVLQKPVDVIPVYMTRPAPYLQCDDCYDSDDEDYNKKRNIPEWATKYRKFESDRAQTTLGHRIKNSFFCCHNHTVNLKEIFERIDPRKLKRTSSANWAKPPRFTMLAGVEEE